MISTMSSLNDASARIVSFFKSNQNALGADLEKIASGKNFNKPSDNVADFFRASNFKQNIRGLSRIQRDITEGSGVVDVAKQAGTYVFEDLSRMQELVQLYNDPSVDDESKAAYQLEFGTLKSRVSDTIENSRYDGRQVVSDSSATPLRSIQLDPGDYTMTFDIEFTADMVASSASLTLGVSDQETENALVQEQLSKAASYLAQANVYSDSLKGHHEMAQQKSLAYDRSRSAIENVDEAKSVMSAIKKDIAHQATIAMMSQMSMAQSQILALFR